MSLILNIRLVELSVSMDPTIIWPSDAMRSAKVFFWVGGGKFCTPRCKRQSNCGMIFVGVTFFLLARDDGELVLDIAVF